MVAHSDNGWPVIDPDDTDKLVTLHIGGATFSVVKAAQAEFRELLTFLNSIEPFKLPGWDGGYSHRHIDGSAFWSTHASGTGADVNASRHPQGRRNAGWSLKNRLKIRWFLSHGVGRCFTWGNDFKRTPDGMHWQLKDWETWLRYRLHTTAAHKVTARTNRIRSIQRILKVKDDGILGPITQDTFRAVRRSCQINRELHPLKIAAVQRVVGIAPAKRPVWDARTDRALKSLGFDVSRQNLPPA